MTRLRLALPALAAGALVSLLLAVPAFALYAKPPGGAWRYSDLFDRTDGGSFALTRGGGRVAKLTLRPGRSMTATCGAGVIRLVSRPRVRSFRSVSGRYAVAKLRSRLFVPIGVRYKQRGRTVAGKLMVLWDERGRVAETGKVEIGDCRLSFYAHKRR